MLDSCPNGGKNEDQNLRDFQTKSSHFAWIELKDSGQTPLSNQPFDVPYISEFDIQR